MQVDHPPIDEQQSDQSNQSHLSENLVRNGKLILETDPDQKIEN